MYIYLLHAFMVLASFTNTLANGDAASNNLHEYHFSYTEVRYLPAEKKLEITVQAHSEDVQLYLYQKAEETYGKKQARKLKKQLYLPIDTLIDSTTLIDKFWQTYLQEHLQFKTSSNGQALATNYLGSEATLHHTYSYIEITNVVLEELWIENQIMLQRYNDQINVVSCIVEDYATQKEMHQGQTTIQFILP